MLFLHQSNSINKLQDWLTEIIHSKPLKNPFTNEQILVQNFETTKWLQQNIAQNLGVTASFKFPTPSQFLWEIFNLLIPGLSETSPYEKNTMTWILYDLLFEHQENPNFAELEKYFFEHASESQTDATNTSLKRYQLATKIAQLFYRYIIYRPDWIQKWESGETVSDIDNEYPWQPILWKALVEKTKNENYHQPHRGHLFEQLIQKLKSLNSFEMNKLPPRVFVFGIPTLPCIYLDVLQALSNIIEIHIMQLNPCQFFWDDISCTDLFQNSTNNKKTSDNSIFYHSDKTESNSLLVSWGKLGRDFNTQLTEIESVVQDRFIDSVNKASLNATPSLLDHIQSQILSFCEPEKKIKIPKNDHSIIIANCHSPLREVEVLHDYLLSILSSDPTLTPKDICIMTPNIDVYYGVIEAVFSSSSLKQPIPFSISNISAKKINSIIDAFMKLLSSYKLRCTTTEILSILCVPSILKKFALKIEDVEKIQQWITNVGIRWGLSSEHKTQQGLEDSFQNTWLFGFKRILLGYAVSSQNMLYETILPADGIGGLSANICGGLIDFIHEITKLIDRIKQPKRVEIWLEYINDILNTFFEPDKTESEILQLIRQMFSSLIDEMNTAQYNKPVSIDIIILWLTNRLENHKACGGFLNGKVSVCSLEPMRPIPFKVICLLGMNDNAYPRNNPPESFDLISRFPRQGDRFPKDDDRYCFLETLLSVKSNLYISYSGRSIKDNSLRSPSILVLELLNYCKQNFEFENGHILEQKHQLHPFHDSYFQPNSPFFTYEKRWQPIHKQDLIDIPFISSSLPSARQDESPTLELLSAFYNHPCKYFFRKRLGVFYEQNEYAFEESEPFDIDALQCFNLRHFLLETFLKQCKATNPVNILKASGLYPIGHFGTIKINDFLIEMQTMSEIIKPSLSQDELTKYVQIKLDQCSLNGHIKHIHNDTLIRYTPSQNKKIIIRSYLEHLALCAFDTAPIETHIFYLNKKKRQCEKLVLEPISQQNSLLELNKLVALYQKGVKEPLPFMPSIAADIFLDQKSNKPSNNSQLLMKCERSFSRDAYLQRVWPEFDSKLFKRITDLANDIFACCILK